MNLHVIAPSGHHMHIEVAAAELIELHVGGVELHHQIAGGSGSPAGWPELQAQLQRIDGRTVDIMSGIDRITGSVANVGTALTSLTERVATVAQAVRDHPAAADDSKLNALADQIDGFASEISAAGADLQQVAAQAEAGGSGNAIVTENPGGAPSGDTTGAPATGDGTTAEQPTV